MIVDRARVAAALPGYEMGDQIGAGAFGLVLAGWHRGLQRDVAIKVLAAGGHARLAAGFAAEARILAGLDHPHIVRVYDYVEADELRLIVMEMLAGGTLTRRQAGMSQQGACAVGLAVAGALSCAHSRSVLHRDIKPDNVLFDTTGLLKVADFGIAKLAGGVTATANTVIGTPLFMAPEQIAGSRLGPATDLYALGVMLYLLLAGTAPFDPPAQAPWRHHLDRGIRPPAGVPAPVAEVVLGALAEVPADRPRRPRTRSRLISPRQPPARTARGGSPRRGCRYSSTARSAPPPNTQPRLPGSCHRPPPTAYHLRVRRAALRRTGQPAGASPAVGVTPGPVPGRPRRRVTAAPPPSQCCFFSPSPVPSSSPAWLAAGIRASPVPAH